MKRYTFFWKTESPFSQWHPSHFVVGGIAFHCAEQYMMYEKARLFGDDEAAQEILRSSSPSEIKKTGRRVRNFVKEKWEEVCREIVYRGNRAKFTQNEELLKALMATCETELVEASPYDCIWGVGLSETDPRIHDPAQWRGTNWLGEILTQLREDLRKDGESRKTQSPQREI